MDNIEFGKKVKTLRLSKKLSQSYVGEKIGADKGFVSNLESGRKNPTLKTLIKLAKALGVTMDQLNLCAC